MICLIVGVSLIPPGIWMYREAGRLCVTIYGDMLLMQHAFSMRSVALADIDGYREEEKNELFLIVKNGEESLLLPNGIARRKELVAWIKENYEDVGARKKRRRR
jgi:hypothetical protein